MSSSSLRGRTGVVRGTAAAVAAGALVIAGALPAPAGAGSAEQPELTEILLTPESVEIEIGQTAEFTATALFADGSEQEVTNEASWEIEDPSVASPLLQAGSFYGQVSGTTGISASLEGEIGSATLTVAENEGPPELGPPIPGPPELILPESIAVLGDRGDQFADYLAAQGFEAEGLDWGDDVTAYDVVLVNAPGDPGEEAFLEFLAETDESGTGVLFADTYRFGVSPVSGVFLLQEHVGQPVGHEIGFTPLVEFDSYYAPVAEHHVMAGFSLGELIPVDHTMDSPHAWFETYEGEGREVVAEMMTVHAEIHPGIAVQERAENRHALLMQHGAENYADGFILTGPQLWTEENEQIFAQALAWVYDADTAPIETELSYEASGEVTVGEEIVITGEVSPGEGRQVFLRELHSPVISSNEAPGVGNAQADEFSFVVDAGQEPGERVFEIHVPATDEATEITSEQIVVQVVPEPVEFVDVLEGDQFYEEIMWLAQSGITTGYADGSYRPREHISREAMAAFLYRYADSPEVDLPVQPPFSDVHDGMGFYQPILWTHQAGIAHGFADGTYRARADISREAIAAYLHRAAGSPDVELPERSPFVDIDETEGFYTPMIWLHQAGIATGYQTDQGPEFRPRASLSRGALAAFLYRFEQNLGSEAFAQ